LALFYQAFNQGQRLMRTLLGSVGQIYSNMHVLENLFDFLALEAQISEPTQPKGPYIAGMPARSYPKYTNLVPRHEGTQFVLPIAGKFTGIG
jgi:hypothetical protein